MIGAPVSPPTRELPGSAWRRTRVSAAPQVDEGSARRARYAVTAMVKRDVRVVYVMGLWRSGSTILDIVLGNHEAIEGVGELRNLPIVGWSGEQKCGCGVVIRDCPHWEAVRERWEAEVGCGGIRALVDLQDRYERMHDLARVLRELVRPSSAFRDYGTLLRSLYEAIRDVGGKQVIVDSTKYPLRAMALTRVPGIDLDLVHLVRDARGVIWSLRRNMNTDLWGRTLNERVDGLARRTALQWMRMNLLCEVVGRTARKPVLRVRYEDLVGDPKSVLMEFGERLGLEMTGLVSKLASGEELSIGHTAAGNQVRLSGRIRLQPDLEWRSSLSAADRRTFWRIAAWQARRYGYRKD